jgi:uncharacterized protein YjbJ (UPF0337 family)
MNSTKDQVEGNVRKIKSELKETGGKHINNPDLERERKDEKIIGKGDIPDDHILMSGKQKAKTRI